MFAMPREYLLGPYPARRGRWRVRFVSYDPAGRRRQLDRYFPSASDGLAFRHAAERRLATEREATDRTVGEALDEFLAELRREGTTRGTQYQYERAVGRFLARSQKLGAVRQPALLEAYTRLVEQVAVATHRNSLAQLRTFLRYCVKRRWLASSPAEGLAGRGRRRRGKLQLSLRDTRRFYEVALSCARAGDLGALAALLPLVLGLRASEVTLARVDWLDDTEKPCDTFRVRQAKTPKGERSLEVPEPVRVLLCALVAGRGRSEPLFAAAGGGHHERGWVRKQVARICALAEVPHVTAQAMRGAHATIALERGVAAIYVAETLGHEDVRTTRESYAAPGAETRARQRETFRLLQGGRR